MNKTGEMNPKEGFHNSRRKFLQLLPGIGLGLSGLLAAKANGAEYKVDFKVLDKNARFDADGSTIETAYKLGCKYMEDDQSCARCVVAALQDSIEFIPKDEGLFRAASCLDAGATPTRVASCGAFTGAGMVIGWVCGTEAFKVKSKLSHKLIRKVYKKFDKAYGSVLCKNVRKEVKGDCTELVGVVSRWTAEILLSQFTNYKGS